MDFEEQNNTEQASAAAQNLFGQIRETLVKIGLIKIAIVLIICLLAGWYLSLPKPGTVSVTVAGIDDNVPMASVAVYLKSAGKTIATKTTNDQGEVRFNNAPSVTDLTIEVPQPMDGYGSGSASVNLKSGEETSAEIKVPKTYTLNPTPSSISKTASLNCVLQVNASVENKGESDAQTSLVGNGAFEKATTSSEETISAGSTGQVSATIDVTKLGAGKGPLKGQLRLKYTKKVIPITLTVTDEVNVDVSPQSVSCTTDRTCQQAISVKNKGKQTLENLKIEPSDSIVGSLANGGVQKFYTSDSIPPAGEANAAITVQGTTQAIGVISVTGDCFSKQIVVKVN